MLAAGMVIASTARAGAVRAIAICALLKLTAPAAPLATGARGAQPTALVPRAILAPDEVTAAWSVGSVSARMDLEA